MVRITTRPFFVDCDDTLCQWDRSKYPDLPKTVIRGGRNDDCEVVLNQKNINVVKKFRKLGYYIVVWSHSGHVWAENVVKACGLTEYVDQVMDKPMFYLDDRPAGEFMGERIWRSPDESNTDNDSGGT